MPASARKAASRNFSDIRLPEQVQLATPVAKRLIIEGLDYRSEATNLLCSSVYGLTESDKMFDMLDGMSDEQRTQFEDCLEASRAIGIAMGLLLRPAVFTVSDE
jgi:hypothetical protein